MSLQIKPACEKCGKTLAGDSEAAICSYECTFCPQCAANMSHICPNCQGELVPRPRRKISAR